MYSFEDTAREHWQEECKTMNKANRILPRLACLRCGWHWIPRADKPPKFCPGCNSPYFDKPYVLKKYLYKNKP